MNYTHNSYHRYYGMLFSSTGVIWDAIIGAVISHDHCIAITTHAGTKDVVHE